MSKPRNARRAQEREQIRIQKALGPLFQYPYPEHETITLYNPGTEYHGVQVTGAQMNELCEKSLADKTPTKNDRGELVFKDDNQKRLWKKNGHLYKQVIQQKEMRDMAKQIGATMKVKDPPIEAEVQLSGGVFPYAIEHGAGTVTQSPAPLQETFEAIAMQTNFSNDGPRYWWFGPIGWMRSEDGAVMVTDDVNANPAEYRQLTIEEQNILDDAFNAKEE